MDKLISNSVKYANATVCSAGKCFLKCVPVYAVVVHSLVLASFPDQFHIDAHHLSARCASVCLCQRGHEFRRPRHLASTIWQDNHCVCVRVLAAGFIAIRVQGEGMVGNQEYKSTILATTFHMSDKMNGNPFLRRKITNTVESRMSTKYLWLCLNIIRFIRKDPDCV